ncbi:hypothetical protein N7456_004538 [Penicillium angulare]|uniref:Uncharacterized protein n=1 Tax=Penicillium angulare TaxID=116970 RepID=A0A9W9KJP0_9EURO|nr:hypothetical protein N7456_004538 [Penicillium angulare]
MTFEDLDLGQAYPERFAFGYSERPKQQRWVHSNKEKPITSMKDVPPGWNYDEPDLDPEDLEAQIARCMQRMEDNIMPFIFRKKMQELRKEKARKAIEMSSEPGLDWVVVKRLKSLERIKTWLNAQRDDRGETPNVIAIMAAYRSGALKYSQGLVTYWSRGKQISQPRPFNWTELALISERYDGHKGGLWVEGLQHTGPANAKLDKYQVSCDRNITTWTQKFSFTIQFTHADDANLDFDFLDDTGSDVMRMYEDDFDMLQTAYYVRNDRWIYRPPIISVAETILASGDLSTNFQTYVHVNIKCTDGSYMNDTWETVAVTIMPGNGFGFNACRISGPWLRAKYYVASAPDGTLRMYAANYKKFMYSSLFGEGARLRPGFEAKKFPFMTQFIEPGTVPKSWYSLPEGNAVGYTTKGSIQTGNPLAAPFWRYAPPARPQRPGPRFISVGPVAPASASSPSSAPAPPPASASASSPTPSPAPAEQPNREEIAPTTTTSIYDVDPWEAPPAGLADVGVEKPSIGDTDSDFDPDVLMSPDDMAALFGDNGTQARNDNENA